MRLLPGNLCATVESDTQHLTGYIRKLLAGERVPTADLSALLEYSYLADLRGDWLGPFRHEWDGEAVRALDLAALQAERNGQAEDTLLLLRREAEFCPDDAALTRRVMLLAHSMTDAGLLRATYMQHCRTMADQLDLEPDQEVVAPYGALSRS